ncbi:hypothetical protein GF312_09465 [Candidatus Poribacteria bacterium]|nr:hypothetical protein [Candidatus Poribacteria bacterium]
MFLRSKTSLKAIKKRRELLAVYVPIDSGALRRVYPETFYEPDKFISSEELEYIDNIYEILKSIIEGHRGNLVEDEINLMYTEIKTRANLGKFSEELISAVQSRLNLKKKVIQDIEKQAADMESRFPDFAKEPPDIKFRLDNTVYLIRLLAYGLFSNNDIVLERVSEVFDVKKLQNATKPKDKKDMDKTLQFLYRGLIQKNKRGRQGSRHAARQTLTTLREWYPDNEYVIMCMDKLSKYI